MKPVAVKRWLGIAGVLLVCLSALLWFRAGQRGSASGNTAPSGPAALDALSRGAADPQLRTQALALGESLRALAATLASNTSPEAARDALAELRSELSRLSPEAASDAIQQILDSGVDAPTRLDFKVGKAGFLAQPPTLRTFLLDELARVDRAAAGRYAEKILAAPTAPDEWALALRNYAWANPGDAGRDFLRGKTTTLLRHEEWQRNPSIGYLEAFDVAVYAGGGEVTTALTDLVRKQDNRAVAHAAFLALDRLTLSDPAATLAQLQQHPELMEGREMTRANYFARADVQDPRQRQLVEQYLLDPRRAEGELQTFAGLFPNANFMISNNLLTENRTPGRTELAQSDRAALEVVSQWLADPRFARLRPPLEGAQQRLKTFISSPSEK